MGATGATGSQGIAGISCWDINANGTNDPSEDVNGDGIFNTIDCQVPCPCEDQLFAIPTMGQWAIIILLLLLLINSTIAITQRHIATQRIE